MTSTTPRRRTASDAFLRSEEVHAIYRRFPLDTAVFVREVLTSRHGEDAAWTLAAAFLAAHEDVTFGSYADGLVPLLDAIDYWDNFYGDFD